MFSKSSARNQEDGRRVYLVYLVCLVYLVEEKHGDLESAFCGLAF
jgi:hypothetical protein